MLMSKKDKENERIEALVGDHVKKAGQGSKGGATLPQGATEAVAEEPAAVEAQVIEPEIVAVPGHDLLHQIYEEATEDEPDKPLAELIRQSAAEAKPATEGKTVTETDKDTQFIADVNKIARKNVENALKRIGAIYVQRYHGGDYKQALAKDPTKDESINRLTRRRDFPLNRQRFAECVRASAMAEELAAAGVDSDALTTSHLSEISKARNEDARVDLAKAALAKDLTVREVRDRVRESSGKPIPTDKRLAHALSKQLRKLAHVTVNDEIKDFVTDKDRLKAAFSTGEVATLLGHSERFRESIMESGEVLHQFEKTLVQLVIEARQEGDAQVEPEADQ